MPKVTRSLRRVVHQVFPDIEIREALRLLEMGLLRIPKRLRCGAYARSTGQPCKAQAIPGAYRCKNHGEPRNRQRGPKPSPTLRSAVGRSGGPSVANLRW